MIPFDKLVGAGNDFVFIHHSDLPESIDRRLLAQEICHRNSGIGADGLVILHRGEPANLFVWDFYNRDGSKAEMCGNAARCTVLFIHKHFQLNRCEFKTLAGTVQGAFNPGHIEVQWSLASEKMAELSIDLENFKTFKGFYINTGVPHFVLHNHVNEVTLQDCAEIQAHPRFGEDQTNVTLLDSDEDGVHKTKTFERGVKSFTLACGTGVIASAFVLKNIEEKDVYQLQAPGGVLSVKISGDSVTLIGPADFVFSGQYNLGEKENV